MTYKKTLYKLNFILALIMNNKDIRKLCINTIFVPALKKIFSLCPLQVMLLGERVADALRVAKMELKVRN